MKLTTTLALVLLVAAGVVLFALGVHLPHGTQPVTAPADSATAAALAGLAPEAVRSITIRRGGNPVVTLEHGTGEWRVDGGWPANPAEVAALLDALAGLHSRFTPIPVTDPTVLDQYGLRHPALVVDVQSKTGAEWNSYLLSLGEPSGGDYRFVRPTYLRLDDGAEVLRVAPGLIEQLGRPAELYRRRRLFPTKRTVRRNNAQERIEQLAPGSLSIRAKGTPTLDLTHFAADAPMLGLVHEEGWQLTSPTRDRLDPDAAERLLSAVADLYAEQFVAIDPATAVLPFATPSDVLGTLTAVAAQARLLSLRTGLDHPERTIHYVKGETGVTLCLGASSRSDSPPPAPVSPRTPQPDSYRYARLEGSELIFEIADNRLNDIFTTLDALRDARLARFNPDDARRVEVRQGKTTVVLLREKKDSWKMLSPRDTAADNDKVKELLTRLSGLEAAERDLFSPTRQAARTAAAVAGLALPALAETLAAVIAVRAERLTGLDRPAGEVRVTIDEKARAEDRDRSRERTIAIRLSSPIGSSKKVFISAEGWPRIDATDDSLAALVERPTATYRSKSPLEFTAREVQRLDVAWADPLPLGMGVIGLLTRGDLPGRLSAAAALTREPDARLTLVRRGDDWALTAPMTTAADTAKVDDLLAALGRFKVLAFVADDVPADRLQADYGLTLPHLSVRLTFADGRPARTLLVGRQRDGEPGSFARLADDPAVFVLPVDLREQLDRPPLAYLPATLWQLAADDDIVRFQIAKAGQDEYELIRKDGSWQVAGPFSVAAPASVVERLTAAVQAPRAEEYRTFAAADLAPFGLDRPAVTLTLTTRKGQRHTLRLGAATPGGKPGRFARQDDKPGVFVLGETLAAAADQSAIDFLDRTLLRFDAQTVTAVVRQRGKDTLELAKEDDAWRLVRPTEGPADERKVPALLRQLAELSAERIVAYRPKDLAAFGLAPAEATLTIRRDEGGKTSNVVLLIGKEDGSGGRFAMVQDAPSVGLLSAVVVRPLLAGPLAFRDHLLARVPDADTLRLQAGERQATFGRPEGTWKLTAPITAEADHDALEAFVNNLVRFRADELVAEEPTPAQRQAFGLDRPAARWQVLSGDETKLDFSVGGVEPAGKRRYAYLPEKKLVVLLDDRLSEQAVAEYRPRTVWKQPVDPAQVEAVRFGLAKDPFEIRKVGGDWQVVGKPEVRLDQATVSDTLSALRDLKLQRYVRDAGAQLKVYGLDPAELALEVTTPTGTLTLHLGGREGGTGQRYARVPHAGRGDVFVLDEAAGGKLFRDLPALTRPVR